jgi:ribonuclease HI
MELIYHLDDQVAELTTLDNCKSSGIKVNLYWIPSHVGIPGNEVADRLASEESNHLFPTRSNQNQLSSAEQAALLKEYLPIW